MFSGFSQLTQDFLWNIRLNNERTWFLAHKTEYEANVLHPLQALGQDVYDIMADEFPELGLNLHVCRIYRDARRLHGRGPYKETLWFTLHRPRDVFEGAVAPAFFFEIAPESWSVGMGCYDATPLTMAKLRARIDRDPKPITALAKKLASNKDFVIAGQEYKRLKGDISPLLNPWYNRKNIALICERNWDGIVFEPALTDEVVKQLRFLLPYYQYLNSLSADPDPRVK